MDIKEYNARVRRKVDPIILETLELLSETISPQDAEYVLKVFKTLAIEYYPEMFSEVKFNDSDI